MPAVYALAAFFMTLAGGLFAFRYRQYLLYIMAFSAGLLIGIAFLDLIPEVAEMGQRESIEARILVITALGGVIGALLLEKLTIIHSEKPHDPPGHHHPAAQGHALRLALP